jgi:hypothetical protein
VTGLFTPQSSGVRDVRCFHDRPRLRCAMGVVWGGGVIASTAGGLIGLTRD